MRKMKCFLLCIISFVAGLCAEHSSMETCSTTESQLGQCINIKQCPPLLNLLKDRSITSETVDYLRKVQCGFEGLEPKVCCSLENRSDDIDAKILTIKNDSRKKDLLPSTDVCGLPLITFIISGAVHLGEYPWMTLIKYETPNGDGFHCEGALINKRYVLTAAHCVAQKHLRLVSVRLGEHTIGVERNCEGHLSESKFCAEPAIDVEVEKYIVHEDYDPSNRNRHHDIALLRLVREVSYTDYVQPVCLPISEDLIQKDFTEDVMELVGWGKIDVSSFFKTKLMSNVVIKSSSNYTHPFAGKTALIAGQMYGEIRRYEDCVGDGGSSLMKFVKEYGQANYFLTGVLSFPSHLCDWKAERPRPNIYTRVTEYVPWIISKLES